VKERGGVAFGLAEFYDFHRDDINMQDGVPERFGRYQPRQCFRTEAALQQRECTRPTSFMSATTAVLQARPAGNRTVMTSSPL
jgi:hypothetical protein